jgi:hypothetical protein
MEGFTFLPLPEDLCITEVCQEETSLLIKMLSERTLACCPLCEQLSDAVHSRYQRRLKDVPCGGQTVCLQLTVHKFFCHNRQCQRKIFTERLPTFVELWAQMTIRLTAALQAIGLSTSGSLGCQCQSTDEPVYKWPTRLKSTTKTRRRILLAGKTPAQHEPTRVRRRSVLSRVSSRQWAVSQVLLLALLSLASG